MANVMYMSSIYVNQSVCTVLSAVPVSWTTLGIKHD
jgi:hypothetical protein